MGLTNCAPSFPHSASPFPDSHVTPLPAHLFGMKDDAGSKHEADTNLDRMNEDPVEAEQQKSGSDKEEEPFSIGIGSRSAKSWRREIAKTPKDNVLGRPPSVVTSPDHVRSGGSYGKRIGNINSEEDGGGETSALRDKSQKIGKAIPSSLEKTYSSCRYF